MSKIISRSYSKEGLDNWDKIFKKRKSKVIPLTVGNSNVIPLTVDTICYPDGNWDDAQFLENHEKKKHED